MKKILLLLSLAASSFSAFADLAEDHQKICQTEEVKALMGQTGTCRVIIAPKKVEKKGVCMGVFMGSLPCYVSYISAKEGSAINLTCGVDVKDPVINQDMEAEAVAYKVAAIVKKENGADEVIIDKNEYVIVYNKMVELDLTGTGAVTLMLQGGRISLTDVQCL